MEQDARLPQSKGEGVLFGIIICFLTALFMSIFNSCISQGAITGDIVLHALMFFPLFMVIAFFVQNLIVGKIANILTTKFVKNSDSFNSRILFTTLFNVIFMSLIMTFIGIVVMTGFSSSLLSNFLTVWPRNFCVVLWFELLIAQPLGRAVMKLIHTKKVPQKVKVDKIQNLDEPE